MEKSAERLKILAKIEEFERAGTFDQDVEDDPEAIELTPDKADYLNKKLKNRILEFLTLRQGKKFYENQEKLGNIVIKEIKGFENVKGFKSGAIVTCNHFHPFDNYLVCKSLLPILRKGKIYKVIKEGNYTNPPKGFEMFLRHGDTLPLSRNRQTMRKFLEAMETLLKRGDKVLVYAEQAMWNQYRKPRPLKNGAFSFAVNHNVPVIPLFVTMEDTEKLDADGFPIQAYTVNILPIIYPDTNLSKSENIKYMRDTNYEAWVKTYEDFYKKPLVYLCDENKNETEEIKKEDE